MIDGTAGQREDRDAIRVLVTGGCGFIGSHLVDDLLAEGYEVVVLDDLSSGKAEQLDGRARLIVGNVADPAVVARAFEGVSSCFHLAAIASVERSNKDWVNTHRANQTGTICVLEQARMRSGPAAVPVVYASSAAVYGDAGITPIAESTPAHPLTAYGADKLGSELHAGIAWNVHRVPTTGLRFFNVYGPRQDAASPYSGVISIFADRLKRNLPIAIYGDGTQVRDFIYVGDVVRHLRQAMTRCHDGANIYNVCTGAATSIRELARLIGDLLGKAPEIRFEPRRAGDILRSVGTPQRAQRELGLIAKVTIDDGLRVLLAAG